KICFFFSSRRRHTRWPRDWSSDVCSSDLSKRITEKDLELSTGLGFSSSTTLKEARENVEREMVQRALKRNLGRISSAAAELGISRPTLYELMERLGISRE